jgi:hypothetical protein
MTSVELVRGKFFDWYLMPCVWSHWLNLAPDVEARRCLTSLYPQSKQKVTNNENLVIPIAVWKIWMIIFLLGILGPNAPSLSKLKTLSLLPRDLTPKISLLHLREYICISFIAINRVTSTRTRFINKTPFKLKLEKSLYE